MEVLVVASSGFGVFSMGELVQVVFSLAMFNVLRCPHHDHHDHHVIVMIIVMIIIIDQQRQILTQEAGLLTSSWMAAWAASCHSCANFHFFSW